MKLFKIHVVNYGEEEDSKAFATFLVLARDEGRVELLVREYIKKEELLKGDVEILDVKEVPTDKEQVLGVILD
ncbi:hypothetical protein PAP_06130 [Palaeococcus pacificus DY20341]|uniref:Uncharacterized protein n=1 Tax=Palaeococcus pacificus DY20341 TaxID=1343739 RepID=A0A075LU30_9EURY|nr:hypothetical protein [Palaeococcus pacificus]AIF69626.1 hypothetical protein PAP_06130 [Palaeococcus pacificus DY20341]